MTRDPFSAVVRVGQISVAGAGAAVSVVVHHFNVPVPADVLDRFIALHYTDWESLNGRNINNWVRAEATPCSLRYDWVG